MSLAMSIALYFIIWWTTLFAVLPLGVRTQGEAGNVVPGTPESAPVATHMLRVCMINTAVATVVFAMVWAVIRFGLADGLLAAIPLGG